MLSYTCSTEGLHVLLFVASEFVCCFLYIVYSILLFPSSSSPLPALAQPLPVLCAHRNSPNSISWNGAWLSVGIWVDTKMLSTVNAGNCCYLFFKEWMLIRVWTVITRYVFIVLRITHDLLHLPQNFVQYFALSWLSLSAKNTPHLHKTLWKPIWAEIPGSARTDPTSAQG